MLLALAVMAGFLAGSIRAALHKTLLQVPNFNHSWIIFATLIPQILIFQIPSISQFIPLPIAKGILIGSFLGLLVFVWLNRKLPGLTILGLGAALNLLVIFFNRGLMPISPDNASYVHPSTPPEAWSLGERLGTGKDVVLMAEDTRLAFLSDRFRLPLWMPYRAAYSLGDIFIALGTMALLWSAGKVQSDSIIQPTYDS
ncbi:MAG TPA: DUF5317 family protein [Anaerolineales bacterium]|nr:DUF5317 family protein [Anaerolineales bacterium]